MRISFSTFIDSPIYCGFGGTMTTYANNIMFASTGDVVTDPTADPCRYSINVMFPQSVAPPNSYLNSYNDPKLVNASAGDYHLMAGSPAIDTANSFPVIVTDYEGTPRPQGPRMDVGAFEYKP